MGTPHKTIFIARFKQYILRQHRVRFGSQADMCGATRDVRFGSKADICSAKRHVRFASKSGHQCIALLLADDLKYPQLGIDFYFGSERDRFRNFLVKPRKHGQVSKGRTLH